MTSSHVSRAIVLACATTLAPPLRVDPVYNRASQVWTLPLPAGSRLLQREERPPIPTGLPPLPSGAELQLEEVGKDGPEGVGGAVWRAAGALCRWQLGAADAIRGRHVLELGAGTGVSGLFAAGLGAASVLLSDGEASLVPLLEANAHRAAGGGAARVTAAHWLFGQAPPACAAERGFDLIIGSDITYSVNTDRDGLCRTLVELLGGRAAARCVIAHEHRRSDMFDVDAIVRNAPPDCWDQNDVCLGTFLTAAAEHGLRIEPLVFERGHSAPRADDESVIEMTTDLSVFEVFLA